MVVGRGVELSMGVEGWGGLQSEVVGGDGHGGGVKWAVTGCGSWNIKPIKKQV